MKGKQAAFSITVTGAGKRWTIYILDHVGGGSNPRVNVAIGVNVERGVSIVREISVRGEGVSPRDVKRLPLATYVRAAILAAGGDTPAAGRVLLAPKGRPRRGQSTGFYRELADFYRSLATEGVRHPAQEIARRKRVDTNTVHQWLHRARNLGFLERPARGKK